MKNKQKLFTIFEEEEVKLFKTKNSDVISFQKKIPEKTSLEFLTYEDIKNNICKFYS